MKKELGYDASGKQTNYLPIPTDDEGKPANPPDIRFDFKVYSEEQMIEIFKVVNPKRKPRAEMEFFPDLTRVNADGYYIAFDHNNTIGGKPLPVGRAGWKWLRKHKIFLTTGIKVIPMYRGMGIGERLWKERDRVIFRVAPAVGFLSNFSPGWINFVRSQYWNIEPPVSTLPPSLVAEAEKTITDPNKPRKMITYNLPGEIYGDEPMRKAWGILKKSQFSTFLIEIFGIPRKVASNLNPSRSIQTAISNGRLIEFITQEDFARLMLLVERGQYTDFMRELERINNNYSRDLLPGVRETENRIKAERARERRRTDPSFREAEKRRRDKYRKKPEVRERDNRKARERYRRKKEESQ